MRPPRPARTVQRAPARRRAVRASAAALCALALSGCVLLDLVLLPLKLVFGALGAVGEGISSVAVAEPIEGPPPRVQPLEDGRWLVEAPAERSRFRVTLSAEGRVPRTWTWPDDFRDVPVASDGAAHVDCVLEEAR